MNERLTTIAISAVVSGAISACILIFGTAGNTGHPLDQFDELTVKNLKITDQITVRSEGKEADELLIKGGNIVATQKIVATSVLSSQLAGHVVIGNRLFATPDKLSEPTETWKMYTEIGANTATGGEIIVRSPNGPNVVGKGTAGGNLVYFGFNPNDGLELFAQRNPTAENPKPDRALFALALQRDPAAPPTATAVPANPAAAVATTPDPAMMGQPYTADQYSDPNSMQRSAQRPNSENR